MQHVDPLYWICLFVVPIIQGNVLVLQQKSVSFNEAELFCESIGGHLPSIRNHQDNERVYNKCATGNRNCWIGLIILDTLRLWTDRSSSNFTNFALGQPDNGNGSHHCGMLDVNDGGKWMDKSCSQDRAYFVCDVPDIANTAVIPSNNPYKLSVKDGHFMMKGQRVFISGANQAWVAYGYDFGNGQYQYRRDKYEQVLREIHQAGGNAVRVWIHMEGETSPEFDSAGDVIGLDKDGTFITDIKQYLQAARQYNVLVFFTLWNAAVKQSFHYRIDGLITNTTKLQSYLDNALVPLVTAVKDEPALGGWDIMNEPEGQLKAGIKDADPCFDTTFLQGSGAGWASPMYTARQFAQFINLQADAIKQADPAAMITVGAWSEKSDTNNFGLHNLYQDDCLKKAGGKTNGTLTFHSIHTYDWNHKYSDDAPFKINATAYGLNKPVMIAEFNQGKGGGLTIEQQFDWAYSKGYCGALTWSETDGAWDNQRQGMTSIKNRNDQTLGGLVAISLN